MRTYYLLNCNEQTIDLPLELQSTGFEPDSVFNLYFLDHAKEQDYSNMLELLLLPFPYPALSRLYSLTIKLKNIPHATGHAVTFLSALGAQVRCASATDSIAGKIGTMETVITSDLPLELIDQRVADAYADRTSDLSRYIDPTGYSEATHTSDHRFLGRFITGRRYVHDVQAFNDKSVTPSGLEVTLRKSSDGRLVLEVPSEIIEYISDKYRCKDRGLAHFYAALTTDTEFSSLSISFLDPNESIVRLTFLVHGSWQDNPTVFDVISNYLGRQRVNFRIVYLRSLRLSMKLRIELVCDISRTEYMMYSQDTLRKLLLVWLRAELASLRGDSEAAKGIIDLAISPVYGYPKSLKCLGEGKLFTLHDIVYLRKQADDRTLRWAVSKMFGREMPLAQHAVIASLASLIEANRCDAAHVRDILASNGIVTDDSLVSSPLEDGKEIQFLTVHSGKTTYLVLGRKWDLIGVCFDNTAPPQFIPNFLQRFHENQGSLSESRLLELCKTLLGSMHYQFPTEEEFNAFGEIEESVFRDTARTRFGKLRGAYIREKYEMDEFPIRGNQQLGRCVGTYLDNFLHLPPGRRLSVLDIGPAAGALTSLFIVQEFARRDLLHRLDLTLMDVSQEVLDACLSGDFEIPHEMEEEYMVGVTVEKYKSVLSKSHVLCEDISTVGNGGGRYDVVVSGFTHHHMNNRARERACRKMAAVAKESGFVGVVDEWMTYVQYLEYLMNHVGDGIPVAQESFMPSVHEHSKLLERAGVLMQFKKPYEHYYCFWGLKQRDLGGQMDLPESAIGESRVMAAVENVGNALAQKLADEFGRVHGQLDGMSASLLEMANGLRESASREEIGEILEFLRQIEENSLTRSELQRFALGVDELAALVKSKHDDVFEAFRALAREIKQKKVVDTQLKFTLSAIIVALETKIDLKTLTERLDNMLDSASMAVYQRFLEVAQLTRKVSA